MADKVWRKKYALNVRKMTYIKLELSCSPSRRRRSIGGELSTDGQPIYDKLERVLLPSKASYNSNFSNKDEQEIITIESSKEHKHNSIDLGELRTFMMASQKDVYCAESTEMVDVEQETQCHRRRFSVEMGEVREFIALRELRMCLENDTSRGNSFTSGGASVRM